MEQGDRYFFRNGEGSRVDSLVPVVSRESQWDEVSGGPSLQDYLLVLRSHRWLIVSVILAIVTVVTISSFKMKPVYKASARVEIDKENPNALPFENSASQDIYWSGEDFIETRARILKSETLALETIRSLRLENHPEFMMLREKGDRGAEKVRNSTGPQAKPAILDIFLNRLAVNRVRRSHLLEVEFEANDPVMAAQVLNSHLENFIEHNFRTRYESTVRASDWLAQQLGELKIKVESSEEILVAYEKQNRIWAIDDKQNITTQRLSDLNRELTAAQSERIRKESNFRLARSGRMDAIPAVRDSEVIQNLVQKHAEISNEHAEALTQFGPQYPTILKLEARREDLAAALEREKRNIVDRVESEYRASLQRETMLAKALERQKGATNELGQKMVQYNILKREAETNQQLYNGLLRRIKEAGVTAGLRSSNIRIVDPALIPSQPTRPRKKLNIMLAAVVGLLGGVSLAFLREHMDNTIKSPSEVERLTGLPLLAVVPKYTKLKETGNKKPLPMLAQGEDEVDLHAAYVVTHERPSSHVAEAFRALRTSLLLSQVDSPPQVILVTSALSGEGKTTATLNLGVTLAQLGDRTLVLDGDLRKPALAQGLRGSHDEDAGLTSYLTGRCSLRQAAFTHPFISNLDVMPTGPIPPNPAEILSSRRMREAIGSLRKDYKFIVVDSPPVLSVTDAVILSVLVDRVLLVVRSNETEKAPLLRTRDLLASVGSPLLGIIVNAADLRSSPHYRYYQYYGFPDSDHASRKSRV
ncbi:MAG: GumC family protein [Acidobacteriota bacterium]